MSSIAQRRVLVAKEAVPGDGTAVNVALRAKASMKAVVDKIVPDEDIGSFAPSRHYIGSLKSEGKLDMDGYFEHAPYPVSMALGSYTAYALGGGVYYWLFQLPDETPNTFATFCMEYTDGVNHIVHSEDVFAKGLEIKGEAEKSWMFGGDLVGANTTFPAALGANPTTPASVTTIRMADTHCYMDTTWAGRGVTEMSQLISFSWKLEELQHQKAFGGSLYPSGRGNNKWKVTLEIIAEMENSVVESIKGTYLNTTQTAIRLRAISGSQQATIDGMFMLNDVDTLDERDGNNIVKLSFTGEKDASNNTGWIELISTLASL